jgi:hypothetical protein
MVRRWVGAVLCVVGGSLMPGLLSGCAIPMPSASAGVSEVQVRLVHVAPNAPRIDLEVGGVRGCSGHSLWLGERVRAHTGGRVRHCFVFNA